MANDIGERLIQEWRDDSKQRSTPFIVSEYLKFCADALERALPIIKAQAALEEHSWNCDWCGRKLRNVLCSRGRELRAIIEGGQSGK